MTHDPHPTWGDFLSVYKYWCRPGTSPELFQRWSGVSLLSAVLQDRVQVARDSFRSGPLSLYTMLVGESGSGKGEAIKRAIEACVYCREEVNPVVGKTSSAWLFSYLNGTYAKSMKKQRGFTARQWSQAWLVAEELAADIRMGEAAQTFLADLTGVWGKKEHLDGTRGWGVKAIDNLYLTVLVGTTDAWLPTVFPQASVESGTLPRFMTLVEPPRPLALKETQFPADYAQIDQYVKEWVWALSWVGWGQDTPIVLQFDDEALGEKNAGVRELWEHYPEEHFRAFMQRADEMIRKLAALLSVSRWPLAYRTEGGPSPYIEVPDRPLISVYAVRQALALYREALRGLPEVIKIVKATPWSRQTTQILSILKGVKGMALSSPRLIKEARERFGIVPKAVDQALKGLLASEEIATGTRDGRVVYWLKEEEEDA